MLYNKIVKNYFNTFIDFLWPSRFGILYHNILPALIALRFDLAALNRQEAVFGLTTNFSENWWSDFLVLGCLTGTDGPDDILLLSVIPSGLDTMLASIIALYCCWSSIFSSDLYIFLLFQYICFFTNHC